MDADIKDIINCSICGIKYDLEKHIPHLLPCSHSLCKQCLVLSMGSGTMKNCVNCRRCGEIVWIANKESTIVVPINPYIVHILEQGQYVIDICQAHNRELGIYCRDCKRAACYRCYIKEHKSHDVIDVEEKKSRDLEKEINDSRHLIESYGQRVKALSLSAEKKANETIDQLEFHKHECKDVINSIFDQQETLINEKVRPWTEAISSKIKQLKSYENIMDAMKTQYFPPEELQVQLEKINDIENDAALVVEEMPPLCKIKYVAINKQKKIDALSKLSGTVQFNLSKDESQCDQQERKTDFGKLSILYPIHIERYYNFQHLISHIQTYASVKILWSRPVGPHSILPAFATLVVN